MYFLQIAMLIPEEKQFDIWSPELTIPVLAIDVVILTIYKDELCVVVVKTEEDTIQGYALPGSIVSKWFTLEENFDSMLKRKTGITGVYKEQLYTFGDNIDRDPRSHVIAIAYYALVKVDNFLSQADFTKIDIVTIDQAMKLHMFYEHDKILDYAHKRLIGKLEYTDIVKELLPEKFRISQMQKIYEIILGVELDKRNFQKKVFSLKIISETWEKDTTTNRPAKLYRFENKRLKVVDML